MAHPQSTDWLDNVPVFNRAAPSRAWPRKWWLHLALFCLTAVTTTAFGYALAAAFFAGRALDLDSLFDGYFLLYRLDARVLQGLYFSVPLLIILLAHEFGHYIACRRSRVEASLPFFLPSPLLLGTCGAFIRIRSPIYSRQRLFDIGVSGPAAGFAVLVPILFTGVSISRVSRFVIPGSLSFGTPLILRLAEWICLHGAPAGQVLLHPAAMAAWAGLLATAMNLLPMGQLDGGHIVYAAFGERWHRVISLALIGGLVLLGFVYRAWWLWAALMFFFGRRHPLVYDQSPLRGWRAGLAIGAFVIFVLSFAVVPVATK